MKAQKSRFTAQNVLLVNCVPGNRKSIGCLDVIQRQRDKGRAQTLNGFHSDGLSSRSGNGTARLELLDMVQEKRRSLSPIHVTIYPDIQDFAGRLV